MYTTKNPNNLSILKVTKCEMIVQGWAQGHFAAEAIRASHDNVRVQIGVTWKLWGTQVPRLQKSVEEGNVRRETWRVGWTNNDFVAAIAIATIVWTITLFCDEVARDSEITITCSQRQAKGDWRMVVTLTYCRVWEPLFNTIQGIKVSKLKQASVKVSLL